MLILMEARVKDFLRDPVILKYYQDNEADETLNAIMDIPFGTFSKNRIFAGEKSAELFYRELMKRNANMFYDIIPKTEYHGRLELFAKIAIENENKEIIEFLHKQNFPSQVFLPGAVSNASSDIIRFMAEIGIDIYQAGLIHPAFYKKDIGLVNYLVEMTPKDDLTRLFYLCLDICFNNKNCNIDLILNAFKDKINIADHSHYIFSNMKSSTIELVKLLLDYGLQIDQTTLDCACVNRDLDLIEFNLQSGIKVTDETVDLVLHPRCFDKDVIKLFFKYDVDFSSFKQEIDSEFFLEMERHGLNKDALLQSLLQFIKT